MSRLSSAVIGGLQAGSSSALAAERLAMAAQQMRRQEELQNLALFRERAARTFYSNRYAQLSPVTPENAGGWSQANDVFMNLPSEMMAGEVDRLEREQKQQHRKQSLDARVYPFLESLSNMGHGREASRRRALYEAMDPSALDGTSLKWTYQEMFKEPDDENLTPDEFDQIVTGAFPSNEPDPEMGPFPINHAPASPSGGIGQDLASLYRVTGKRPSPSDVVSLMRSRGAAGGAEARMQMSPEMVKALRPDFDDTTAAATAEAWNGGAFGKTFPRAYLGGKKTPQTPDKGSQADAEDVYIDAKRTLEEAQDAVTEVEQDQIPLNLKGSKADQWIADKQRRLNEAKQLRDQARRNLSEAEKRKQRASKGLFTSPAQGAADDIDDDTLDRFINEKLGIKQ